MWLDFKLTHQNGLLLAVCYQPQIVMLQIGSCFICVVPTWSTTFWMMLRPPFFCWWL